MATYDFAAQRLHVEADLAAGTSVEVGREAAHYLLSVLRLDEGAELLLFNGRHGEWRAALARSGRRDVRLAVIAQTRPQPMGAGPALLFAPLKHARLDYMVQKAVEMGVARLAPVMTRRTVATRVNLDRMRANAVEAAEQCGVLVIPEILAEKRLEAAVSALAEDALLVFCDEDAPLRDPVEALRSARPAGPVTLLVGPEGGFDPAEREMLLSRPAICRLSLGPRILRADTAAVAALALVQAVVGDWREEARASP